MLKQFLFFIGIVILPVKGIDPDHYKPLAGCRHGDTVDLYNTDGQIVGTFENCVHITKLYKPEVLVAQKIDDGLRVSKLRKQGSGYEVTSTCDFPKLTTATALKSIGDTFFVSDENKVVWTNSGGEIDWLNHKRRNPIAGQMKVIGSTLFVISDNGEVVIMSFADTNPSLNAVQLPVNQYKGFCIFDEYLKPKIKKLKCGILVQTYLSHLAEISLNFVSSSGRVKSGSIKRLPDHGFYLPIVETESAVYTLSCQSELDGSLLTLLNCDVGGDLVSQQIQTPKGYTLYTIISDAIIGNVRLVCRYSSEYWINYLKRFLTLGYYQLLDLQGNSLCFVRGNGVIQPNLLIAFPNNRGSGTRIFTQSKWGEYVSKDYISNGPSVITDTRQNGIQWFPWGHQTLNSIALPRGQGYSYVV